MIVIVTNPPVSQVPVIVGRGLFVSGGTTTVTKVEVSTTPQL